MYFNLTKIKRRIEELARLRYREVRPLEKVFASRTDPEMVTAPVELQKGMRWGERDAIYKVTFAVEIPQEWQHEMVALHVSLSPLPTNFVINTVEGLLYVDGMPFHALDRFHREIVLTDEQVAKGQLEIAIRVWTGINEDYHTVQKLELQCIDENAYRLHSLMVLLVDALENLTETASGYLPIATALEEACQTLDFRQSAGKTAFYHSCEKALANLKAKVHQLNAMYQMPESDQNWQPKVIAVGHAHIDVAWLWQLRHTRIKAADTFSTALYHMERYPDFTFIQSQPQLYQFVKEDQPELYARIKEKVANGQWEPEGAMWVESDINITGAESLVRQFLFGQRFFQKEFGYTSRVVWLPDVFGYSAALPQLIKGAEAEYFITSKISWNDTNRFPADTFWWQGLDGTQVLTYFLTAQNDDEWYAYTYNGEMRPGVLARCWKNYQQKDVNRETLVAYGYGDGGGGPTLEMVEALAALNKPLSPDLPVAVPGKVADFMARLEQKVAGNPNVPQWVGELYFELHRGTYTSQARTKRNNRLAERDLHNAEWLSGMAALLSNQSYPQDELNQVWQKVLTHQFHDILPGSSIGPVYSDAVETYTQIREITDGLVRQAQTSLSQGLNLPGSSLLVFNGLGWQRSGLVELDQNLANKLNLPRQELDSGRSLVEVKEIPSFGYQAYSSQTEGRKSESLNSKLEVTSHYLESDFYRLELNEKGQITRLFDKSANNGRGREVLAPGARANVFQLFEDKPLNYDAWDIDAFYEQKSWELDELVGLEVIEQGPLRAGLRLEWLYNGRTRIIQKLYLYANQRRIDFVTEVEWQERQTLLKVAFPVAVHNGSATADIQFGNIERSTHRNTSWDKARFETCAHKWFDLSEGDYGVAVLNDCKYGYDVNGNTLRLTLLRGAIYPDAQADLGQHEFTYSLLPHQGGWFEAEVDRRAYELNHPLLTLVSPSAANNNSGEALPVAFSLVQVAPSNVVIETIKQAEDSTDLIIRVYECANRRGTFELNFPFAIAEAVEVNLLENELPNTAVEVAGKVIRSHIQPYQIKTFKVKPVYPAR